MHIPRSKYRTQAHMLNSYRDYIEYQDAINHNLRASLKYNATLNSYGNTRTKHLSNENRKLLSYEMPHLTSIHLEHGTRRSMTQVQARRATYIDTTSSLELLLYDLWQS